jgi:hypothetical protein
LGLLEGGKLAARYTHLDGTLESVSMQGAAVSERMALDALALVRHDGINAGVWKLAASGYCDARAVSAYVMGC